jgi:hypothetical protein
VVVAIHHFPHPSSTLRQVSPRHWQRRRRVDDGWGMG